MTLFLPRRTELQPRRGPLVVPGLCGAPARTPGPERVFDLFAGVFQMRPALVLPALPFECDVSGRSTDHLLAPFNRCALFLALSEPLRASPPLSWSRMVTTPYQAPTTRQIRLGRW
jgi:hypothetical protein